MPEPRASHDWSSPEWPWPCERCGLADDAITAVGRRQLCTACRQALDLCTLCAEPALFGEWWCSDCSLSFAEYLD